MPKLTEKAINAEATKIAAGLKSKSIPAGDTPGLSLVLRQSGSHSWRLVYRPAGSSRGTPARTVTLGSWPSMSLDAARKEGRALIGRIASGSDPAVEKRHGRHQQQHTVERALGLYETALKRRRIVNIKTTLSALQRGLKPFLKDDVSALDRKGIVRQVNALVDDGKPGAAADLRKHSRSFCEWAVNEGLLPFNPMAGLRLPRLSRDERLSKEESNLTALTDTDLKAVWAASKSSPTFGALVRLALATGLRRGELAHLTWHDVRADRIIVPAPRTKTGVGHQVPLSPLALAVLASVPHGIGALVFPSGRRVGGQTPLSGWTQLVAGLAKRSGVQGLRLHALRRTFRTKLTEAGVSEAIAELTIGHQRQGLVKLYDHAEMWPERVAACEAVGQRIAALVGEGQNLKILRLRR